MERRGGTSDPKINESEVIVGERAIVVIQPIIGEQVWCGVEGSVRRVVGDPTSEVPVLHVQQPLVFFMLGAQPSSYNLAKVDVLRTRVRGRGATIGDRDGLCAIGVGKVIPIDAARLSPKVKRRPGFCQIFPDQCRAVFNEMVVEEVDVGGRVIKPADDGGGCPAKNIGSLTKAQEAAVPGDSARTRLLVASLPSKLVESFEGARVDQISRAARQGTAEQLQGRGIASPTDPRQNQSLVVPQWLSAGELDGQLGGTRPMSLLGVQPKRGQDGNAKCELCNSRWRI